MICLVGGRVTQCLRDETDELDEQRRWRWSGDDSAGEAREEGQEELDAAEAACRITRGLW